MTANNLATVVGPNMVPPGDAEDPIAYLNHNKGVVQGISVLIENYDKIFSGRVPSNVIIRAVCSSLLVIHIVKRSNSFGDKLAHDSPLISFPVTKMVWNSDDISDFVLAKQKIWSCNIL